MASTGQKTSAGPLRIAWLGRVSTDDQQDPTLSLPRQLHKCREALPDDAVITSHFYDIESGRKDLEARGNSSAHLKFEIPISRDGGIQDLLKESLLPTRRFDAVMCESIERVARRLYYGTKIEHDLERAGVALFASDEPIVRGGKRASMILTRRVKQSVAEWYVLEILEKSWDGLGEHSRQGWNVGSPPYGYVADKIPHPVPARRAEGRTKTKLAPDPVRAAIVHQIFIWRVVDRLGYAAIANLLNDDLQRFPPPESPDPARRRECWGRSSVYEILRNPKYTGFMVWNRRATKKGGKVNPEEDWVWSPDLTHEPIVPLEMWRAANTVSESRKGSRNGSDANVQHPLTQRKYVLRSYVICDLCGNRMAGKLNRRHTYYNCEPRKNLGPKAARLFPEHPTSIYVREDQLLTGILGFVSERVFSDARMPLLEIDLKGLDRESTRHRHAAISALEASLKEMEDRQDRQIMALEKDDDPDGILYRRIRERVVELETKRADAHNKLRELQAAGEDELGDPSLMDEFPVLEQELSELPDELMRTLFDALRLSVRVNKLTNRARVDLMLTDEGLDTVRGFSTNAFSAPNGNRTKPVLGFACATHRQVPTVGSVALRI